MGICDAMTLDAIAQGRAGRPHLRFLQHLSKNCVPQYWVDGRRVSDFEIDDLPASHIEGVELYAGPATTPGEFRRQGVMCGTVVIWSKVPSLNLRP